MVKESRLTGGAVKSPAQGEGMEKMVVVVVERVCVDPTVVVVVLWGGVVG